MLATAIDDIESLKYPVYISGKLDGIRVLNLNGRIVTRNLKPLRNDYARTMLETLLPDGADGEIICGNFQQTTSNIMSQYGKPNFQFFWFDWIVPNMPFLQRQNQMEAFHNTNFKGKHAQIVFWESILCRNSSELLKAESAILAAGLEGVMVRDGQAHYKHGRSTLREGILLKLKRFTDSEATIIGFQELLHNGNTATTNALGRTERSQHASGLTQGGMLGALLVKDVETGIEFGVGTGFTDQQRRDIWAQRDIWLGKHIKYKYQEIGQKDAPRFPSFIGLRDLGT